MKTTQKDYISVFTASVARALLKEGYTIVDIKPDKLDAEKKRTIFVFRNENGLLQKMREIKGIATPCTDAVCSNPC